MGYSLTSLATTSYYEYLFEITSEHNPTKLMYGWSKWGGGTKGMVQEKVPVWYCQSCRSEISKEVDGYMFPIYNREFGKICQDCLDGAIRDRVKDLWKLMKQHKIDHGIF